MQGLLVYRHTHYWWRWWLGVTSGHWFAHKKVVGEKDGHLSWLAGCPLSLDYNKNCDWTVADGSCCANWYISIRKIYFKRNYQNSNNCFQVDALMSPLCTKVGHRAMFVGLVFKYFILYGYTSPRYRRVLWKLEYALQPLYVLCVLGMSSLLCIWRKPRCSKYFFSSLNCFKRFLR